MNPILFPFLFFLPAGIANVVPVLVAKIPLLAEFNYPLDFGKKFNNRRILGDNKTIRGLISGVFIGTLMAVLENHFFVITNSPILLGFLLSLGGLIGDSIKSFFKRQVGIKEGKSWFPFDQIDYIFGGLLFSLLIIRLPLINYLIIFIIYFFLHLITSYIGFILNLKKTAI